MSLRAFAPRPTLCLVFSGHDLAYHVPLQGRMRSSCGPHLASGAQNIILRPRLASRLEAVAPQPAPRLQARSRRPSAHASPQGFKTSPAPLLPRFATASHAAFLPPSCSCFAPSHEISPLFRSSPALSSSLLFLSPPDSASVRAIVVSPSPPLGHCRPLSSLPQAVARPSPTSRPFDRRGPRRSGPASSSPRHAFGIRRDALLVFSSHRFLPSVLLSNRLLFRSMVRGGPNFDGALPRHPFCRRLLHPTPNPSP